jgi:hypothetical protein
VGGLTGERPAVVLRWWGRRLVAVGWGILDVREVRVKRGCRGCCTAGGEMRKRWGKSDLKVGHERPSSSTFELT